MFKVEDVQMVRAMGSGVAGGHYGFADLDRGEEKEGVVQPAPLDETSESAGGASAPGGAASKLFTKSSGNEGGVGEAPIAKHDWLVGSHGSLLP